MPTQYAVSTASDRTVKLLGQWSEARPQWSEARPQWSKARPQWSEAKPQWSEARLQWSKARLQWSEARPQWLHSFYREYGAALFSASSALSRCAP